MSHCFQVQIRRWHVKNHGSVKHCSNQLQVDADWRYCKLTLTLRQVGIKTKSWSWANKSKIQNREQKEEDRRNVLLGRNSVHEEHAVNWQRRRWNTQTSIHEEGQVNKDQDQKRIREETKTGRAKQENTRGEAPQNNTNNKLDTVVRNTGTKPEYQLEPGSRNTLIAEPWQRRKVWFVHCMQYTGTPEVLSLSSEQQNYSCNIATQENWLSYITCLLLMG